MRSSDDGWTSIRVRESTRAALREALDRHVRWLGTRVGPDAECPGCHSAVAASGASLDAMIVELLERRFRQAKRSKAADSRRRARQQGDVREGI